MKKIELKIRKSLRNIFKCFSLTAVAFIFQACYGPISDCYNDVKFAGTVTSKTTNLPIKGIKVTVNNDVFNMGITDENGNFEFYSIIQDCQSDNKLSINFLDIDGINNGCFADSTIIINSSGKNRIIINVELEEKQCE